MDIFIPIEQIEYSYAKQVEFLSKCLIKANIKFIKDNIIVDDFSNASGHDWSGYPNYTWHIRFSIRTERENLVELIYVTLYYKEPIGFNENRKIDLSWCAEKFYIGQTSHFKKEERNYKVIQLEHDLDLYNLILQHLELAKKELVRVR